jgi:hypothetical protein
MSHWLDKTSTWLEIFKRKLNVVHKDLFVYLDKTIEESSLEFIDVQACALSACRAVGYPIFSAAIENEMGFAPEKNAAAMAASMAALNCSWITYLESVNENHNFFDVQPDVLVPYGGTSETKFNMYLLSASVIYGNRSEILRLSNSLKNNLTQEQINDIVKIASVIHASIKTQT